jgi:hypothetical protein
MGDGSCLIDRDNAFIVISRHIGLGVTDVIADSEWTSVTADSE